MSGQPLLSIIILNRNHARSLPRLLLSLRRQTAGLSGTEIVFIDTGSTDGSPELMRSREKSLGCINTVYRTAFTEERRRNALNIGMGAASGEFLLAVNSDDHLDPNYLERSLDVLAGAPYGDIAYTGRIRSEGKTSHIMPSSAFDIEDLKHRDIIGPAAVMRRTVWEETGEFRPAAMYQGWDFWIRACLEGFSFVRIPDHLFFHADTESSAVDAEYDARAKARIVIKNQSFYTRETVRWAMGRLRGEPWAKGFEHGVIPDSEDVRLLLSQFILSAMDFKRRASGDDIDPYLRLLVA